MSNQEIFRWCSCLWLLMFSFPELLEKLSWTGFRTGWLTNLECPVHNYLYKKAFSFFLVSSLYLMRGPYTASKDVGKRGCCIHIKISSNLCGFYFAEEGSRILKGVPFQQLKHPPFKRNLFRIIHITIIITVWENDRTFNFCNQLEEQED